jgi:transglutaminase-like putative cysteine protease
MYKGSWDLNDYRASKVLKDGEGYCVQKSILLAALARAAGIPTRFILAAIRNHKAPPEVIAAMGNNLFFPHIYDEFYIDDRWLKAAPTFDRYLCQRINVPTVEFNGDCDAVLPAHDFKGQMYIEYVEDFGTFEDMPWEFIMKTLPRFYDETYFAWQASLNPGIDWKSVGITIGQSN